MKMTKKISKTLILSAAAALAFGAVAAGTTYALFTSQAGADVAVASGKVSLKTEIKDLKLYSLSETTGEIEAVEGEEFANGGTVKVDGEKVALDKITPGDKVEFTIVVTNESNVDIKYHKFFQTLNDTGLCDGLEIKVDGEAYDGSTLNGEYENWLQSDANKTKEIKVSIELPKDKGKAYQDKKCDLCFKYEAIQKNAKVEVADETTFAIYTPTDLAAFAKKINAGTYDYEKTILMNDVNMAGLNYTSPFYQGAKALEFDGNNHKIQNLSPIENKDGSKNIFVGFIGKVGAQSLNVHDLTMENINVYGTTFTVEGDQHAGGGTILGSSDAGASSIVIKNVSVSRIEVKGVKYAGALIGYSSVGGTATIENAVVNNAKIAGYTAGGVIGQVGGGSAVINGVKGSGITVDGYKREGGMVGAVSGSLSLDITYDETGYSSTISGEAIAEKGTVVGLTGNKTTVNGQNYYTALSTADLENISGLSAEHTNIVEIGEGTYEAAALTVFDSIAGGVKIVGRGDKEKVIWHQANEDGRGYNFNGTAVTMENVSISSTVTESGSDYNGFPHAKSTTFIDCVFPIRVDGTVFRYWGDGAVKFQGCKFDAEGSGENNMMAYGGTSFEFDSCEFISDAAAIKLYKAPLTEATDVNVTVTNCTFKNVLDAQTAGKNYQTALSLGNDSATDKVHWNVVMNGGSVSGNYSDGLLSDHKGLIGTRNPTYTKKGNITLTLDGEALDLGLAE